MQTVFAFPLPSCHLAPTSVTPSAPPLLRDVGKVGGMLFSPPFMQGLCRPAFVHKQGVISGVQGTPPPFRPLPPLMLKRTTSAGSTTAASLSHAPICVMGALFVPQQGTGMRAHGTIPCPLPFEQEPGGAWRGHQDGSRHAAGMVGTPPSIFVQACHRVLPSPPLSPSQCACNGVAQNLSHANWGALRGSGCPSCTVCEHNPMCIPHARPLCPTIQVLCSHRHMQGGMQKVGHAGVVHAAQHTGCAHIPSLQCANRRPHIGNVCWPCSPNPLQTGV